MPPLLPNRDHGKLAVRLVGKLGTIDMAGPKPVKPFLRALHDSRTYLAAFVKR